MRKLSQLLLSIIFIIPMLIGGMSMLGIFSNASKTASNGLNTLLATSNGGGGGNSLKSDDNGNLPHPDTQETTTYTFKTYEDYFIDFFNLPAETYTIDPETLIPTVDYSLIKKTKVNGETQLSYNGNVFYVVTSDDLTGTGSETDPYVIHSRNGFLILQHYKLGFNVYHKYVELDCEVVLNDETFDEEGNPSGGDGTVYSWKVLSERTGFYFDGKNHSISGIYFYDEELNNVSLFYSANTVKNTKFRNVFLKGSAYVGLIRTVHYLYDCVIESGTIISTKVDGYTGGFAFQLVKIAKNCVNYAIIDSQYIAGGISGLGDGSFYNCKNYGSVYGKSCVGGIVGYAQEITISHCDNYGMIDAATYFSAGIAGCTNKAANIRYCNNYGDVVVSSYQHGACAGIVGRASASLSLYACNNYAKIVNKENFGAEIVGYFQPYLSATHNVVLISNCNGYYGLSRFLGSFHVMEYPKYDIIIENCYFYSKPQRKATYIIGGGGNEKINYYIKNMKVNVGCNDLYITQGGNECIIEVENLLIKGKCNSVKFASSATFFVKSIVQYATNAQGETLKYYYGSNFSGFYFSWQTGNIGLIALDGRGSFQGKIDEEWLLRKGFEKKEV